MAMTTVFVVGTIAVIFAMLHSAAIDDFFREFKSDLNKDILSQYLSIVPVSYSDVVPRPTSLTGVLYKPRYPNVVYSAEDTNPSPSIVDIPSGWFDYDQLLGNDKYNPERDVFKNSPVNLLLYNRHTFTAKSHNTNPSS